MHAEPVGLDAQWPSRRLSVAGAGVQEARPQYADAGTSPFADAQDQEVKALVSEMQRQIEESRAANSQVSLERDEALARNACLTQIVNKSHKQRAGGGKI